MELLGAAWQWRPKATLTAADTTDQCTIFALQYSDCAVLQVHWNAKSPLKGPQEENMELHGHAERIVCVKICQRNCPDIVFGSASRDWYDNLEWKANEVRADEGGVKCHCLVYY